MSWCNFERCLLSRIARIFPDNSGASATILAIALPGLIGFGALGAETGVWFTLKLQNQSAADAAALSAAYQVVYGKTNVTSELTPAANEAVARNAFKGTIAAVIYPYSDSVVTNGVAVSLEQTQGTLLAAIFLSGVTVTTKAVAVVEVLNNPCVLALGTTNTGVEVADFAHLGAPNCSLVANSIGTAAIELHGSTSSIAAATLVTAGEVSLQGNPINPAAAPSEFALDTPAMIGAPSVADPYSGTLTHSFLTTGMPTVGRCGSTTTAKVKTYEGNCVIPGASLTQPSIKLTGNTQISGPWTILTNQTVDLSAGTYWLSGGDLTIQSKGIVKCTTCDNVKGTGVTIVLTAQTGKIGVVATAANAIFNLSAPSSGRFAGLVIAQDSNGLLPGMTYTSSFSTIAGASSATLNGLLYFPRSSLTFHGNPSATGPKCLLLVVNALMVDQTSSLETQGCANAGLVSLPTVYTVALAE
jgi:hypothetical protein